MPDLLDVVRLLDGQHRVEEAIAAYRGALAELEADRRRRYATFGIPADEPWPASRLYHEQSAISPGWTTPLDTDEVTELTLNLAYRRYPGTARVALANTLARSSAPSPPSTPLVDALRERRSAPTMAAGALRLSEVAQLLALSCGITDPASTPPRRAAPSPGALYPVEAYLLALSVDGLERGAYHYLPLDDELEFLHRLESSPMSRVFQPGLHDATPAAVIVLTAVLSRVQSKYRDRGYRFAHLEAGHIGQNLSLVAAALSLAGRCVGGFCDDALARELRLDGDEVALYCFLAGRPSDVTDHPKQAQQ